MAMKLTSYEGDYRAWKTLIAAAYNDAQVEFSVFEREREGSSKAFLEKSPMGKVPVLDTPHGPIFESNAIARYVARIVNTSGLYGNNFYESAVVDQWVDFCANELEAPRAVWLYPVKGLVEFNKLAYDEAVADVTTALGVLDRRLHEEYFLASNQVTLADITVVCALVACYQDLFSPEFAAHFPNVLRWFSHCVQLPHFADVIGKFEFAKAEKKAAGNKGGARVAAGAGAPAAEHKEDEAAGEHKQHEKGGKKDKKEKQKQKEQEKPQGGGDKQEKGGKKDKKDKKKKGDDEEHGEKPAASNASEALEDAMEAERAAEAKKKNPLDDLPKSKMVLDDVKRLYFKERPFYKGFWDEFWGGIWDPTGYCAFYSKHTNFAENEQYFMTANAIGGFLQRLDRGRKYMFGVLNLSAVNEDTPPYHITGAWIFRGLDIPFEMKDCADYEFYTWSKLDFSKEADRKVLMDEFQADKVSGLEVLDRRFFK